MMRCFRWISLLFCMLMPGFAASAAEPAEGQPDQLLFVGVRGLVTGIMREDLTPMIKVPAGSSVFRNPGPADD